MVKKYEQSPQTLPTSIFFSEFISISRMSSHLPKQEVKS